MASKKKVSSAQIGFAISDPTPVPVYEPIDRHVDLDSFDDYPNTDTRESLSDPDTEPPAVSIRYDGDTYWVSRSRNDGTTIASVSWSRKELQALIDLASSTLEST